MDQKTIEALTLTKALYDQIKDLSNNAKSSIESLKNPALSFCAGNVLSGQIVAGNFGNYYLGVCFDAVERAEIIKALEHYRARLDSILEGCSIKISQGVKDLLAEGEKFRDDMRKQAAALKSENGDKKK